MKNENGVKGGKDEDEREGEDAHQFWLLLLASQIFCTSVLKSRR